MCHFQQKVLKVSEVKVLSMQAAPLRVLKIQR